MKGKALSIFMNGHLCILKKGISKIILDTVSCNMANNRFCNLPKRIIVIKRLLSRFRSYIFLFQIDNKIIRDFSLDKVPE